MKKDTLPTESSIKKLIMWYKVKELKSKNLKNTQISRQLGIHKMTVARYLSMSEAEFMESSSYNRYYRHKLDEYEDFVVGELRNEAGLSAAQIEDHLGEQGTGQCSHQNMSSELWIWNKSCNFVAE